MGATLAWTLVSGAYPPESGGVSDYTRVIAHGLHAAGDDVEVWAPGAGAGIEQDGDVIVHRVPGAFGAMSVRALDAGIRRSRRARRVLVQYTPHAFGWKAMNVPFCLWLLSLRTPRPWVMFHEVAFPFERAQPWRHRALATVTHAMAATVANAAERIFVAIPPWRAMLEPLLVRARPLEWLPVPSNLPTAVAPAAVAAARAPLVVSSPGPVVGHFGTFGAFTSALLRPLLPRALEAEPTRTVLLIGRGSREFAERLCQERPQLRGRVHATGGLDGEAAAAHIKACDVLLQPYPDGISTRRGTAMAALALGQPIVTTEGFLSEPLWRESRAVKLAPVDVTAMLRALDGVLDDAERRRILGERAAALYRERFATEHVVRALRMAAAT